MTAPFIVKYRDQLVVCLGIVGYDAVVALADRSIRHVPLGEVKVAFMASDWPTGIRFADEELGDE